MFGIWEEYLDTTWESLSSTLSGRVRLVISRLALIFVLPLDFHGRVRVFRSMSIPCALHGVEASYLSKGSFMKLRSAILRAVWSRKQPLACAGAVLFLLDGPQGCDPSWRGCWILSAAGAGAGWLALVMVLHMLWWPVPCLLVYLGSVTWLVLFNTSRLPFFLLGARSGFRCGPLLDTRGSHQLNISSHVRERDKAHLRGVMVGGVCNVFFFWEDAW